MDEVPGGAGLAPDFDSPFSPRFDALMNAPDEAGAMQRLQAAVKGLGFDHALFAVVPRPKVNAGDVYLRHNYPARWFEYYDRNDLRAIDPTVAYCFQSSSPFVWTRQSFKTPEQRALHEQASAFGLKVGVTLPVRGVDGEIGMLTCARDQNPGPAFLKDLNHHLGALSLLRDVAADALRPYARPSVDGYADPASAPAGEVPVLTARERACLQWMCAGKTAWEIGRILGISEAGVNFHIANLRGKFGVSRRNDVVLKAIRLGIIDLPG